MTGPAAPRGLRSAAGTKMSFGIFGYGPHKNGRTVVGGYATIREYEFHRSVRVRKRPSNRSFTISGFNPTGTATLRGINTASTITQDAGRRHRARAARSERSRPVADRENATAA